MNNSSEKLIQALVETANHLRAAADCLLKLTSPPSVDSKALPLTGGSPLSLAQRCFHGVEKCRAAGKIEPGLIALYLEDIKNAEASNDTKTLNLLLGRLLDIYRS